MTSPPRPRLAAARQVPARGAIVVAAAVVARLVVVALMGTPPGDRGSRRGTLADNRPRGCGLCRCGGGSSSAPVWVCTRVSAAVRDFRTSGLDKRRRTGRRGP